MKSKRVICESAAGGVIYFCIELMWRGYSHPVMIAVGSTCCSAIIVINDKFRRAGLRFGVRTLASVAAILAIELASGLLINVALGMDVWDYSSQPFNLFGQICPLFALLWTPLAAGALCLDDLICGRPVFAARGRRKS